MYYPMRSLVGYYQHLMKGHVNFNQFLKFYALFLDELDIFNNLLTLFKYLLKLFVWKRKMALSCEQMPRGGWKSTQYFGNLEKKHHLKKKLKINRKYLRFQNKLKMTKTIFFYNKLYTSTNHSINDSHIDNMFYGPMKADKQLTQNDDAGHKSDIVINNIH
jgi:hypothetical protein